MNPGKEHGAVDRTDKLFVIPAQQPGIMVCSTFDHGHVEALR